ncbi:MAG: group I intron-associated PD-(D/E)XK endonuclease [bacterium]|nr:group I intron-associated PD-(D/E)XK endonuclease [bacterium]
MLNSRSKGEIGQLKIQIRATELGAICSVPTTEVYYDLILDFKHKHKNILRSQIKYCNRLHGKNLEIRLDNSSSKRIFYQHTDIDLLLIYLPQKDVVLKYEKQHFHRKKTIQINLINSKSKWYYKHFEW